MFRGVCRVQVAAIGLLAALLAPAPSTADDRVVRTFASGTTLDTIGLTEEGSDIEADGPQAIYADDAGEVYLLDQNNGRVLQFDPQRPPEQTRSLTLPSDLTPTDLVILRDNIYVWDNGPHSLRPIGDAKGTVRSLTRTRAVGPDAPLAVSAFAQMGSQELESPDDVIEPRTRSARQTARQRKALPTRGKGVVHVEVVPNGNGRAVEISVHLSPPHERTTKLTLKVRDRIGAAELLDIDVSGRYFILAENIPDVGGKEAAAFIVRYSAKGVLEGLHELPLSQSIALSRRFVTISPTGKVYFLRTKRGGADVLEVGFRPLQPTAVVDVWTTGRQPPRPSAVTANAAVRQPTRRLIIENALAFESLQWRVSHANYGADPDRACSGFRRVRRPGYLAGTINREVRGVPYCWGCLNSINQISARIARGDLAGNVCTRDLPRRDVFGVDCSAFVSAAWGLSTHFTTMAIPAITRPLDSAWDLLPGDALNKPGSHVVLFLRFTPDRKAEVIEASPGRCNGRVCRNVYPLSAMLARGFVPVRYRGIASDNSARTPARAATSDLRQ